MVAKSAKKSAKKAAHAATKKAAKKTAPGKAAKKATKTAAVKAATKASAPKSTAASKSATSATKKAVAKKAVSAKPAPSSVAGKKTTAASRKRTGTAKTKPVALPSGYIPQRTIFIDVENTSHQAELEKVIDKLDIDRTRQPTRIVGVGNWRLIGQRLARQLASLGAQLVHSAPVSGVRDWSDLWIAVSAGLELGRAKAGDILEIVSNDRAFDAVGDSAAALGITFRRVTVSTSSTPSSSDESAPAKKSARRRRRPRGRGGSRQAEANTTAPAAPDEAPAPPKAPASAAHEPHGASHAQLTTVLSRLMGGDPERWVNLDVLEKALKEEGFSRPAGSPRLVTRLRHFADLEVSPHGRVRIKSTADS